MSRTGLLASRVVWRRRAAFRHRRWTYWRDRPRQDVRVHSLRRKWWNLYDAAQHEIRRLNRVLEPPVVVMFDSVDLNTIPASARAVAGYVGGHWPTFQGLVSRFPGAHHLSIAVNSSEDAECLDIENGDATPVEAPVWFRRQKARSVKRPCFYASLSIMSQVREALSHAGIQRGEYRLWVAHYTFVAHLEPGYDACQWTDRALGRNLDQSLCSPTFFD